jgi:quinol monooxygenase YgiN
MKPVTVINVLTIKDGKMDEFLEIHESFSSGFGRTCAGLTGGRMYRSLDGRTAILISEFESVEAQEKVRNLPEVKENVRQLQPLVEEPKLNIFETAYAYGKPLTNPS